MRIVVLFFIFAISFSARAGILLDVGGTYISDGTTSATTANETKLGYNFGMLFNIQKNIWGGWSYSGFSHSDTRASATTALSGQDTGPAFKWQFGRNRVYSLGFVYNVISRATYSTSAGSESWEGTSFLMQIGAMPEISNGWRVGVSLSYYSASYGKKKVNNVESGVSYSKTWLYPALGITKEF